MGNLWDGKYWILLENNNRVVEMTKKVFYLNLKVVLVLFICFLILISTFILYSNWFAKHEVYGISICGVGNFVNFQSKLVEEIIINKNITCPKGHFIHRNIGNFRILIYCTHKEYNISFPMTDYNKSFIGYDKIFGKVIYYKIADFNVSFVFNLSERINNYKCLYRNNSTDTYFPSVFPGVLLYVETSGVANYPKQVYQPSIYINYTLMINNYVFDYNYVTIVGSNIEYYGSPSRIQCINDDTVSSLPQTWRDALKSLKSFNNTFSLHVGIFVIKEIGEDRGERPIPATNITGNIHIIIGYPFVAVYTET